MFCNNCGSELKSGYKFCNSCGAKIGNNASQQMVQASNKPIQQNKIAPQPNIVIVQPEPPPNYSDATIHHARKKGDDVSTSFGRAFGDITGRAFGCAAIILGIIVFFVIVGFIAFR